MKDGPRLLHCVGCGQRLAMLRAHTTNGYDVYRCSRCRTLVTDPLPAPEAVAAYYAEYNETYTAGMEPDRYAREMPKRWLARLDTIRRFNPRDELLDLAGSNGMFGRVATARGFRVRVADFIPAPRDLGFTVAEPADLNRLNGVPFADESFDVVTLWCCIEHVLAPEVALAESARLVRRGDLVAVDTPLLGDACEELAGARSHWVCPPEHLHLYSAAGLRSALERAGLAVLFHAPFFERTRARWVARRGRNLAVAAAGLALRLWRPSRWREARGSSVTQAGDIQFAVARKP